jgi:hypothetical protein
MTYSAGREYSTAQDCKCLWGMMSSCKTGCLAMFVMMNAMCFEMEQAAKLWCAMYDSQAGLRLTDDIKDALFCCVVRSESLVG